MRELMLARLHRCENDRKTIEEFVDWLESLSCGKLVTLNQNTGTGQDLDIGNHLDEFHGIDRARLRAEGQKRMAATPPPPSRVSKP